MKKLLLGLSLGLIATVALAADREAARQNSALLNSYVTASQSTTPNKSLMYRSGRDNVDDVTISTGLSLTKNATTIVITRGENLSLTRCSADYGTVDSPTATTITINSDRAPIRVLCTNSDGSQRVFYTSYQSN